MPRDANSRPPNPARMTQEWIILGRWIGQGTYLYVDDPAVRIPFGRPLIRCVQSVDYHLVLIQEQRGCIPQ